MERAGEVLGRLFGPRGGDRPMRDQDGYRLDCCDECTAWSKDRRVIVQHRVHCDVFERALMRQLYPDA